MTKDTRWKRELNDGWAIAVDFGDWAEWAMQPGARSWWCGPKVGFSTIPESAIVYVQWSVANRAAELLIKKLRKDRPLHLPLILIQVPEVPVAPY